MIGCRECEKLTSGDCGQHWRVATTINQQTVERARRDLIDRVGHICDQDALDAISALIDAAHRKGYADGRVAPASGVAPPLAPAVKTCRACKGKGWVTPSIKMYPGDRVQCSCVSCVQAEADGATWERAALSKLRTWDAIQDRARGGDSIAALADDYDAPPAWIDFVLMPENDLLAWGTANLAVAAERVLTELIADLEAQYATTEMTTPCSFDALDECGRIIDWLQEIKKAVTP